MSLIHIDAILVDVTDVILIDVLDVILIVAIDVILTVVIGDIRVDATVCLSYCCY